MTEGLVGTFVNTLVLRTDLSGNPEFGEFLNRVRATALDAFTHQDISFERLVRELGHRRDSIRAPLAQVLFNVTNAPMHGIEFEGLDWEPMFLDRGGAQFELSLAVDSQISRTISIEYNTDLFDRATIERLIGQYFTILEGIVAAPDTRLGALPLLPRRAACDVAEVERDRSRIPDGQDLFADFRRSSRPVARCARRLVRGHHDDLRGAQRAGERRRAPAA